MRSPLRRPWKRRLPLSFEVLENRETISDTILGAGVFASVLAMTGPLAPLASIMAAPQPSHHESEVKTARGLQAENLTAFFAGRSSLSQPSGAIPALAAPSSAQALALEQDPFSTLDQDLATLLSFDFAKAARAAVAGADALPAILPPLPAIGNGEAGGGDAASSPNAGDDASGGFTLTITPSLPTDQAGLEAMTTAFAKASALGGITPPAPPASFAPPSGSIPIVSLPRRVRPNPPAPVVSRPGTLQPLLPTGISPGSAGGGAMASSSCSGVVLTNSTLDIGVNPEGHLITCDGMGGERGLKYNPPQNTPDVLNQGDLGEGWGVRDALTGVNGYASRYEGVSNLTPEPLTYDASTATSKVKVQDGSSQNVFEVTHAFQPLAASNKVYEITVTVKNVSGTTTDLRYRRVMDWDAPTVGTEYVTVQTNGDPCVTVTNNDGLATAKPGGAFTSGKVSPVIYGDFDTRGAADQGALFEFNFGTLANNATKTFKLFYGAGDSRTEAEKILDDAGADAFSLAKDNSNDTGTTFFFGVDCGGGMPVALAPESSCGCGDAGEMVGQSPHLGGHTGGACETDVRVYDGAINITSAEFGSSGFGTSWGQTRSWSNGAHYAGRGTFGMGMVNPFAPRLVRDAAVTTTIALVSNATTARFFDYSGGIWQERHFGQDILTANIGSNEFLVIDTTGNMIRFHDFSSGIPARQRGQLKSFTDPSGNVTSTTYNTIGQMTEVQRSTGSGGSQVIESYLFTYNTYSSSESNTGRAKDVTLRRQVGGGSWATVRISSYTYYDGSVPGGSAPWTGVAGDLMLADVKLGPSGDDIIDTSHYRYYVPGESDGYMHGLKFEFRPQSLSRLITYNYLYNGTDTQVAPFADRRIKYDAARRVSGLWLQGAGCSACSGGLGMFEYTYASSTFSDGYNNWSRKVIETLPDHESGNVSQNIIYTNYAGEPMLKVYENGSPSSPTRWRTFYQYDSAGRLTLMANPSAVTGHSESSANLGVTFNSTGLFQITEYGTSTTATADVAGDVLGYVKQTKLRRGESGTPVLQSSQQYKSRTDSGTGAVIYPVDNMTRYRQDNGTEGQTTRYHYSWHGTTTRMESVRVTHPVVTTTQNGPGGTVGDEEISFFDTYGRLTWHKDGNEFITLTTYDPATSAIVQTITDVETSLTTGEPWETPMGGGLHLITQMEVDSLGRTTKLTHPAGNIDYTVYLDLNYEVRTYPGWDSTALRPTGPIQVSREHRPGIMTDSLYYENLTLSATPTVSDGRPTGAEDITDGEKSHLLSLARSYTNLAGQITDTDRYFSLTDAETFEPYQVIGTEGGNFHRTRLAYDSRGRQSRVQTPTGTIERTVYDGLGRVVSTWVGTNDMPASGTWSPSNRESPLNMVQLTANVYDGGSFGDSNLTRSIAYPNGGTSQTDQRVTDYFYDWRNRLVATKGGVLLDMSGAPDPMNESADTQRPIVYTEYNNLSQTIGTEQYDGDTVTITSTNGVPNKASSTLRRVRGENLFDERGRVYRSLTYSVDQAAGTLSTTALTSNVWFNRRGQTIKTAQPGGLVSKSEYDGVGRVKISYITDGGSDTDWTHADDVAGDTVLSQTELTYDRNSNVLVSTSRERFHNAVGTGALIDPANDPKARVSYVGNYYDKADRLTTTLNVGTYGGNSWTRPDPTMIPARSDTVLRTDYAYAADEVQVVPTPSATFTLTYLSQTTMSLATNASASSVQSALEALSMIGMGKVKVSGPNGGPWAVRFTDTLGGQNNATLLMSTSQTVTIQAQGGDAGRVQTMTDARDIVMKTDHDLANRTLRTVEAFTDFVPSTNDDRTTEYSYDGSDHTLTLTAWEAGGTTYQRTQWVYGMTAGSGNILNSNDLLKETRYPDKTTGNPSTAAGDVESYQYNALSEVTVKKERNRNTGLGQPQTHTYGYDVLGRRTADAVTVLGDGVNNAVQRIETTYDTAGRPFRFTSYSLPSGGSVVNQVERGYNGLSQLITEYQSHAGAVNTMTTPKVQYTYSEMANGANHSRMTAITYPNGRVVNYNYTGFDDTISRLSEVKFGPTSNEKETYTYLGLGTVVVRAHPEPNVNLSYLITGTSDGGDQYVGLDRFGRIVEQRWDKAGTATDRFTYTYDRDSNRLTKSLPLTTGKNETYGYDLLNQLTTFAQGSTHTQSWTLDALGNWSTFTNDGTPQTRTHNRQNQVTVVGSNNLTFDNNGNTTTDDTGKTLIYDAWNRLMSVAAGANTVSFTYDALARRLTETKSSTTTDLYYSEQWQVLEERIGSAVKVQYVWSPACMDAMVLRDRDAAGDPALEERLYVQQDANFNVTALVDVGGTVVERYVEDPYGKVTILNGSWVSLGDIYQTPYPSQYVWVYLHQGGRYETVSALYHFRNRDLSATLGRWVQRDPIENEAGDNNLYRYLANGPLNSIDPSGLIVCINKITVTNKGEGFKAVKKLGPINDATRHSHAFKWRIDATVTNGDDIQKAEITQEIFFLAYNTPKPKFNKKGVYWLNKSKAKFTDDGRGTDVTDVTEQEADAAWGAWQKGIYNYTVDATNKRFFHEKTTTTQFGKDWLESIDVPGWPGDPYLLHAEDYNWSILRIAVRVTAKGTDGKAIKAEFWIRQKAQSINDKWEISDDPNYDPATGPQLPHTWEKRE